jgi:hypothetical protein
MLWQMRFPTPAQTWWQLKQTSGVFAILYVLPCRRGSTLSGLLFHYVHHNAVVFPRDLLQHFERRI